MAKGSPDGDRRRRAFLRFMEVRGLKPGPWARRAGLPTANAIYNFLRGDADSLSQDTLDALASAEGVQPDHLTGVIPVIPPPGLRTLKVIGHVQAGQWREATEWPVSERFPVSVPVDEDITRKAYALQVRGNSMNAAGLPNGSIAIVVNLFDWDGDLRNEDFVVVECRNRTGQVEATVKQIEVRKDVALLWPRSYDPEFAEPIRVPWPYDDSKLAKSDHEEVKITAIVVGSYARVLRR